MNATDEELATEARQLRRAIPLTPAQTKILRYIHARLEKGDPPAVSQIMAAMDIASPNGVVCHLTALAKKGYLTWEPKVARSIRLVGATLGLEFDATPQGERLRAALATDGVSINQCEEGERSC